MQKNFLEIIQKIEWTSVVDSNTLISADGWKLSYSIDLHYSSINYPSVQVIFKLSKSGAYVMTWGCSNQDQPDLVDAFLKAKNKAFKASMDADSEATTRARALLANMI